MGDGWRIHIDYFVDGALKRHTSPDSMSSSLCGAVEEAIVDSGFTMVESGSFQITATSHDIIVRTSEL